MYKKKKKLTCARDVSDASRAPRSLYVIPKTVSATVRMLTCSCGCGTGDRDSRGGLAVCHCRCDVAAWCWCWCVVSVAYCISYITNNKCYKYYLVLKKYEEKKTHHGPKRPQTRRLSMFSLTLPSIHLPLACFVDYIPKNIS